MFNPSKIKIKFNRTVAGLTILELLYPTTYCRFNPTL